MAVRCAEAIGGGLARLREAEAHAGRAYVAEVEAQRRRDAVEVPGLSAEARAAVRAVEGAQVQASAHRDGAGHDYWAARLAQEKAVAEVWAREVAARPGVEAELRAFAEAAGRRLGEDGARELMRGAWRAGDGPGQRQQPGRGGADAGGCGRGAVGARGGGAAGAGDRAGAAGAAAGVGAGAVMPARAGGRGRGDRARSAPERG